MIDKLPYEITDGFKAAQEGLVFPDSVPSWIADDLIPTTYYSDLGYVMPWPEVADWVRVKPVGKCAVLTDSGQIVLKGNGESWAARYRLDRVAFLLVDDADAFRILHWCAHVLSD